jgi:hypothetical protein
LPSWTNFAGLGLQPHPLNLETAVGREKDVQDIDVHGEFEKRVVTLLVMSIFFKFPRCIKSLCRLS